MILWMISDNVAQIKSHYFMPILQAFLAKGLSEIALPWQHLRSQVIITIWKGVLYEKLKVRKFQLPRPNGF